MASLARRAPAAVLRNGIRSFSALKGLPPHQLIPMPKFSPSMQKARVTEWFLEEGSEVAQYELIFEAEMTDLTDGAMDNDLVRLVVESHEEGYLAKVFHSDEFVHEGTPIAVLCEEEGDIAAFADLEQPSSVDTNEIDFLWQAYAAKNTGPDNPECCQ
jgi:pyruvate/2-oxoglutarate dehydrogenase complex dihydrolipoamide acyltransferase (E2) component